ncbi:hypothetical protein WH87_07460 [Devosia epidermidihirudinis]|uniref:Peptide deformylase-like n=1 Tax=Devosia epidermidihirudinis TaxID=1293439 RepID=A0A0F5QDF4_9HYPH|nr:peptide deformylase [Devosia epidermidihirudinis]KKC38746.1 hypothetical protein WH87_07460 [Devosia epidermidihirudinis]
MTIFVRYPDAALAQKATQRPVDAPMVEVGKRLLGAAQDAQAYGLAAAHIGAIEPLVVISVASDTAERDYRIFFNPEVVHVAQENSTSPEGSVSAPGLEVPVERPVWAEIAYDSADGERHSERFTDFVARVALHEIDQMNGVFFLSRVSRTRREMALRKLQKSAR